MQYSITMKQYTVSLKGLGYNAQSAVVTVVEASETGIPFEILKGLPTLELVSVTLDKTGESELEDTWAKNAAWSIAFRQFQTEVGINF